MSIMKKNLHWALMVLSAFVVTFAMAQTKNCRAPDMVLVKGGTFMMGMAKGHNDEAPPHKVTLGDYSIGKFEVSYAEFKAFVDATGFRTDAEQPDSVRLKHGLPPKNIRTGSWKTYASGAPMPPS